MIQCDYCGSPNEPEAYVCVRCGGPLEEPPSGVIVPASTTTRPVASWSWQAGPIACGVLAGLAPWSLSFAADVLPALREIPPLLVYAVTGAAAGAAGAWVADPRRSARGYRWLLVGAFFSTTIPFALLPVFLAVVAGLMAFVIVAVAAGFGYGVAWRIRRQRSRLATG